MMREKLQNDSGASIIIFPPLPREKSELQYLISKLSVQQTIVPGRLRSELCAWGVKFEPRIVNDLLLYRCTVFSILKML